MAGHTDSSNKAVKKDSDRYPSTLHLNSLRLNGPYYWPKMLERSQSRDRSDEDDASLEVGLPRRFGARLKCGTFRRRSRANKTLLAVPLVAFMVLCLLRLTDFLLSRLSMSPGLGQTYKSVPVRSRLERIVENGQLGYSPEITRNVIPLQCHSHNDYWHRVPLYEALLYGCASVEADIWLTEERNDSKLYVGHSFASLETGRTLNSLYIGPLLKLLDAMNPNSTKPEPKGVFATYPSQSLVLLVDIKNKPALAFEALTAHLEPLRQRDYLTYHNGSALVYRPLTVVTTGSTPYGSVLAQDSAKRDIFFDAPLADLHLPCSRSPEEVGPALAYSADYNKTTSLYASASLRKVLGSYLPFFFPWNLTAWQIERIRSVTKSAHARGLKVRWWDTPSWPKSRREWAWKVLMEEGADVLNADDLEAARDWEGW